jgi:branched-chain amino acid transport system permease protein
LGLNLIVGYTGLLSVAHAAFYGIGAYTTAILLTKFGLNFFISVCIGIIITGALAFLIGLVLSKFDDDYYALVSLGFTIIIYSVFLNWMTLTRGPLGIAGIARPSLFGISFTPNLFFLMFAVVFLIIIYLIAKFIVNSSFGRVIKAIRDNELAIQAFGYNTHHWSMHGISGWLAFCILYNVY